MSLIELSPLISIIIPVYNVEAYLEETLTSVYTQTYNNWECIIVNDGSTDNSLSIAKQWAEKDQRFKVFSQENAGVSAARNYGIDLAKGEYIAFLDSDDVWMPLHLEKLTNYLFKLNPELVFSSAYTLLGNSYTINYNMGKAYEQTIEGLQYGKQAIENFLFANKISTSFCICKKEALTKIRGFSFHKNAEDYHCWLNLLLHNYSFFFIKEATGWVRVSKSSLSSIDRNCTKDTVEVISILKEKISNFNISYKKYFNLWARRYFLLKNDKRHYLEAIKYIHSIDNQHFSFLKTFAKYLPTKVLKLLALKLLNN